jgi:hypothetical protein
MFGGGAPGAFSFLKLLSALSGAGFLAAMTWLFRELGVPLAGRLILLILTGVSLTAWFHFAAFETYAPAMPFVALYLVALARLCRRPEPRTRDHVLCAGSLLIAGWVRLDLFRLAVLTAPLLLLPSWRGRRIDLLRMLMAVAVLGVAGNTLLAAGFMKLPLGRALVVPYTRFDRAELSDRLRREGHLTGPHLLDMGRAATLYSVLMPVTHREPGRTFLDPPHYTVDLQYRGEDALPSTRLFLNPARHLLEYALSAAALTAVVAVFVWTALGGLRRVAGGDPFHVGIAVQVVAAWLFFTWFNPHEPFLWAVGFLPFWMALLAARARRAGVATWVGIAVTAALVAGHNAFAFYLAFR